MREIRVGTILLNAKGKRVRVTQVYFSRESSVMVQISANCHATLTHPIIDTKAARRTSRKRPRSLFVTTAAEWYTRRHTDRYRSPPPNAPHPMREELHHSSAQSAMPAGPRWTYPRPSSAAGVEHDIFRIPDPTSTNSKSR